MATKRSGTKSPVWRPSDIAKPAAAPARNAGAAGARPAPAYVEIGARAIYEMRSHPKKAAWELAPAMVRDDHIKKMEALVKVLRAEGFAISADKRHTLNTEFKSAEARALKEPRGVD